MTVLALGIVPEAAKYGPMTLSIKEDTSILSIRVSDAKSSHPGHRHPNNPHKTDDFVKSLGYFLLCYSECVVDMLIYDHEDLEQNLRQSLHEADVFETAQANPVFCEISRR